MILMYAKPHAIKRHRSTIPAKTRAYELSIKLDRTREALADAHKRIDLLEKNLSHAQSLLVRWVKRELNGTEPEGHR